MESPSSLQLLLFTPRRPPFTCPTSSLTGHSSVWYVDLVCIHPFFPFFLIHSILSPTPAMVTISPTSIIHQSQHFREYEGFRRISFHQDYIFVCFGDVVTAANAITKIHAETEMNAAYAKHGVASNSTPTIQVAPNPILYVSIFPCFGEAELLEIFSSYEGFDSCRFFPMHALVRFVNLDTAKRALEDLNMTTNLFANYSTKSTKAVNDVKSRIPGRLSQEPINLDGAMPQNIMMGPSKLQQQQLQSLLMPASSATASKCTIHVTNLDKDIPTLLQFFKSLPGFTRVAFYIDYAFVIFMDSDSASAAIETILFGSRMKANFARSDYTPHIVPATALGQPSSLVRISDYPSTTNEEDLRRLVETFRGVTGINVFHSSALVTFESVETASAMVDELNGCTNLTCVFGKRKGSGGGLFSLQSVSNNTLVGPNSGMMGLDDGLSPGVFDYGMLGSAGVDNAISPHGHGMYNPGDKDASVFDAMFPSLGASGQNDGYHQSGYSAPQHHMLTQRNSVSTLGSSSSSDGVDGDRRNGMLMSMPRQSQAAKLSAPPGFGHQGNAGFYNNAGPQGAHSIQQPQLQQLNNNISGNAAGSNSLLQPRATSYPSLSALNFSNSNSNPVPGLANLNLYQSAGNEASYMQQQQQQQAQQQQQQQSLGHHRHLSTSSSSQGLYATFQQQQHQQSSVTAPEFFPQENDYMYAFASSSTPPPPGINHPFQKSVQSAAGKRPFLNKGLSTPPPTPFTRTNSPLNATNNAPGLDVGARLAQLEAENTALRRNAKQDFPSFGSGGGGNDASDALGREALLRRLMVKLGVPGGDAIHSDVDKEDEDTDSEETSVNGGDVDWKASFEAAVDEILKTQELCATQRAEFERFQALHKNCGFLQGLLNICD
ncbi:hypothetical protein BC830DRAFT_1096499 [Chytriomyces sp. MP71]|nr:hypothetical protein BC830DRAFT_1096499 [Chytriomyces sp. MP71]